MPLLFSYGTLQNKDVQVAVFGRELAGQPDALQGYKQGQIPITDAAVLASGPETHYANVVASSDPEDAVTGSVFEVTGEDLASADTYEEDANYRRVLLTLASGAEAWVYIAPAFK